MRALAEKGMIEEPGSLEMTTGPIRFWMGPVVVIIGVVVRI